MGLTSAWHNVFQNLVLNKVTSIIAKIIFQKFKIMLLLFAFYHYISLFHANQYIIQYDFIVGIMNTNYQKYLMSILIYYPAIEGASQHNSMPVPRPNNQGANPKPQLNIPLKRDFDLLSSSSYFYLQFFVLIHAWILLILVLVTLFLVTRFWNPNYQKIKFQYF